MILGIGIDLVDCRRIERALEQLGQRFLNRLFTESERYHCDRRKQNIQSYGKLFAAKEAVLKALGMVEGISWHDIEICHQPNGKPTVILTGQALANLNYLSQSQTGYIDLSITDEPPYAQAIAIISTRG